MVEFRTFLRDPIRAQWLILAISVLLIGSLIAYALYERRENILHSERERLIKQSEIIDLNLRMQSKHAFEAILAARKLLPTDPQQWRHPQVSEQLGHLLPVAGKFSSITVINAAGLVQASTRLPLIGHSLSASPILEKVRDNLQHPDEVAIEFYARSDQDRHATVGLPVLGTKGQFSGMIMADLNGDFSSVLLDSIRYSSDMRATLLTHDGIVLAVMPEIANLIGNNVSQKPGSKFMEHRESGRQFTDFQGLTAAVGDMPRLGVLRRIEMSKAHPDQALHVFLSRDPRAVLASWKNDAITLGMAYLLLSTLLVTLQAMFYVRQKRTAGNLDTLRAELAESETDLRTILDNLPVMVSAWDENLRNRFLNPAYERVFGLNVAEQRGRHMRDVITPTYFEHNRPYIERVLAGEPQSFDLTVNIPGVAKPMQALMFYIPRVIKAKVCGFYVVLLDVTAMSDAQESTRLAKLRYDQLVTHIPVGIFSLSIAATGQLSIDYASDKFLSMLGVRAGRHTFDMQEILDRLHEDDRHRFSSVFAAECMTTPNDAEISFELRYLVDEEYRWIQLDMTQMDGEGGTRHWHGVSTDITDQHRAMEERNLAAAVFEYSQEAIFICNNDTTISRINPAFTRITGYARDEVLGQSPAMLKFSAEESPTREAVARGIRRKGFWRGEVRSKRKGGQEFTALMSISMVSATTSSGSNYVGSFTDITHLKTHAAALHEIAHFDLLTRIPNRRLLQDRLQRAVERARRRKSMLAVCYMDLDGFKPINDSLGHEAGDKVLVTVAERLTDIIRTDDTVARLGGDEFVLLLCDLQSIDECQQILARVLLGLEQPIALGNATGQVSASIGVTIFPNDADDPDTLLRQADQAMYGAKKAGKRRFHFFTAEATPVSGKTP